VNNVNLIGRWVREHDVAVVGQGVTVVKNTLAVDHPFKKDDSSFIRVVMFAKTGELANQYTGKGSKVAISGHIQTGSYEKDGVKIYTTDVIGSNIEFLDSKKDTSQNTSNGQSNTQQQQSYTNTQNQQQSGYSGQQGASYGNQQQQQYKQPQYQQPQQGYQQPIEVDPDELPF